MKRREFLKSAAVSGATVAAGGVAGAADAKPAGAAGSANAARLPRRPYGKTGIELSIIGFPGFCLNKLEQKEADRTVAMAVERGVNYFDVAPAYGNAEERMGPALEPYRKNVFLACKTGLRTRDEAEAELKRSLERLRTDHFDLYQLHAITDVAKDVDAAFAKGGVMELFIEAKKAGLVRHLGFSAHSVEAATAALDRFDFDSILFPINFACYHKGNFGPKVVALAREKGAARLALKGLAKQRWGAKGTPKHVKYSGRCWYEPITDATEQELGLRFTLSQPITAAVPPADASLLPRAIELGMRFKPITEAETGQLQALAAGLEPVFKRA